MVTENKFLSLEVQQLRFLKYKSYRLLLELLTMLIEVLDDLEMNLFVLDQQWLYF